MNFRNSVNIHQKYCTFTSDSRAELYNKMPQRGLQVPKAIHVTVAGTYYPHDFGEYLIRIPLRLNPKSRGLRSKHPRP